VSAPRLSEPRPGLWTVEVDAPGFAVRAAVLLGRDRALVWDTLCRPSDMEPVRGLLAGREPVVVYSHADWDHVWGTAGLEAVRAVIAHEGAALRLAQHGQAELDAQRALEPGRYDAVRLVHPTETFAATRTLDLGAPEPIRRAAPPPAPAEAGQAHAPAGGELRVVLHALPGHTPDSAVAWLPHLGVLLAGDAVETPLPEVNDAALVPDWIRALEGWAAEPGLELVVPSHGAIGGPELLLRTAEYLRGLLAGRTEAPEDTPAEGFYREVHTRNVALVTAAAAG